jgi:hypothetical protein
LELYDPDNVFMAASDSGFTGEDEAIIGVEIPDDGNYTIVLRDFFDDGGEFALTVAESSEAPADEDADEEEESSQDVTIFLFVDDDGEPIEDGFTSQTELETLLEETYTVETWISTVDGPLTLEVLESADLLIWDSGDYLEEEGFFDEDTIVIFEYLDTGRPILVTGSSPTIFGDIGLSSVSDLEFAGNDEILLEGFTAGVPIELDGPHDFIFADFLAEDLDSGSTAFLVQGANSENSGNVVGLASFDELNNDQQTIFLLMPFSLLPEDVQELLLTNMLTWFGFAEPEP